MLIALHKVVGIRCISAIKQLVDHHK
jgi:hypothetical protein